MAKFSSIKTGNPDLDRVQQNVELLASQIPVAATLVVVTVTTDYTVTGQEDVIHVDAQRGPVKVTLGKPSTGFKPLAVKQTNPPAGGAKVNPVTVATGDGSMVIGGRASVELDSSGTGSVSLTCDGRQYWPSFSGGAGSSSSGAGVLPYVPGDGISIAGNVISSTVTGGTTNVRGQFPIRSTGGPNPLISKSPWLNQTVQHASPTGDNDNDGRGWDTALGDIYTACQRVIAAGGGTVEFAAGTPAGGPIPGQGIWLRQDYNTVPGFLNIESIPITIQGWQQTQPGPFQQPGPAAFTGPNNAGGRTMPAIWIVGGEAASGWELDAIATPLYLNCPFRTWDYHRNFDGSLLHVAITNSVRSSGQTTHTVTLPTPVTVTSASRTAGLVAMYCDWPLGYQFAPGQQSLGTCWARITSSDPNFPSIDAVVTTSTNAGHLGDPAIAITYTQAGADVARGAVTGITFASHAINAGNRIELFSSSSEFPTTQYKALATTVDTITVKDIYGYSPRTPSVTVANIGSMVKQEREMTFLNNQIVSNCYFTANSNAFIDADNFLCGPLVDVSTHTAFPLRFFDCSLPAYYWGTNLDLNNDPRVDQDRSFAILQDGKGPQLGVSVYDSTGSVGGLRIHNDGNGRCTIDDYLVDSPNGICLPTLDIVGNPMDVVGRRIISADSQTGAIRADAYPSRSSSIGLKIIDPGLYDDGPMTFLSKFFSEEPGPWARNQRGTWQRGIAAPWAGLGRAYGVYQAPFVNRVPNTWSAGMTATGAPDGSGNTAYIPPVNTATTVASFVMQPGDRIALGTWVNTDNGASMLAIQGLAPIVAFADSGGTWDITGTSVTGACNGHWAAGWQWNTAYATLNSAGACTVNVDLRSSSRLGSTTKLYTPTAFVIPASVASDDAAEIIGTMRQHPPYLQPGSAGTAPGIKLIGHGGLGVDSSVLVTPTAGTPTLVKFEPRLAADGTTIQGYGPLYDTPHPPALGTGDHKVAVNGADATPDFLINKIGSTSGSVAVTTFAGGPSGPEVNLNVVWVPFANLNYSWAISAAPFTSFSGYLYTSSQTNYAAGGGDYETGVAATTVRLSLNVDTNSLTGGTGNWTLVVRRNGVDTAATFTLSSGTTGKMNISDAVISGAANDTYSLFFTTGGGLTGGSIGFTAVILVSGG